MRLSLSSTSTSATSGSAARSRWTWAIRTDCAPTPAKLHEDLDKYGIANSFEVYPGTHTSKVADRFQNRVLTFFGQNLCFEPGCR